MASYFAIEYFLVVDLQVLICVFAFPSPAAKMPRTSSSGDDTAVGQTVPSTIVDPSSGIGATPSASSSDVDKAVDAGKLAMIAKPARKIWHQGICPNKSSCISSLELICVGSILNLVVCNYFVSAEMRSWERM